MGAAGLVCRRFACASAKGHRGVFGEALRVRECVAMVMLVKLCRRVVVGIDSVQSGGGGWVEVCEVVLLQLLELSGL